MFLRPITFVIGAGANSEIGFPTGQQLKASIATALSFKFDAGALTSGDANLYRHITNQFGNNTHKYIEAGYALVNAIDSFISIDEALHFISNRPEAIALGKSAITNEILKAEHKCTLFNEFDPQTPKLEKAKESWLHTFFSMAISSLTYETIEKAFANVTIIDFNYDRSFEFYILGALQTKTGLSENMAKSILNKLRIIKPYGSLGQLFPADNAASFGENIAHDYVRLFAISDSIRTYTEHNFSTEIQQSICKAIEASQAIVFLGFGFHDQNMKLLKIDNSSVLRKVFATVKGINSYNHNFLQQTLQATLRNSEGPMLIDCTARQLLKNLRISIIAATA